MSSTSDTAAAAAEVTPPATAPPASRRTRLARITERALLDGGGVLIPLTIGAAFLAGAYVRTLLTPDGRFVLVVVLLGLLVVVPVALAIVGEMR